MSWFTHRRTFHDAAMRLAQHNVFSRRSKAIRLSKLSPIGRICGLRILVKTWQMTNSTVPMSSAVFSAVTREPVVTEPIGDGQLYFRLQTIANSIWAACGSRRMAYVGKLS